MRSVSLTQTASLFQSNNVGGSKNVRIQAGRGGAAVVSAFSLSVLFPRLVSARRLLVVGKGFDFWRNLGGITYISHIDVSGFDIGFVSS